MSDQKDHYKIGENCMKNYEFEDAFKHYKLAGENGNGQGFMNVETY